MKFSSLGSTSVRMAPGQTGYERPLFSVVIVTYKRSDYLARALQALQNQKNAPLFEILIIDNDPKKTAARILEGGHGVKARVRYFPNSENNVSLARNLGASFAEGSWICFLDDDCLPEFSWLETAARVTAMGLGPWLVFGGGYKNSTVQPAGTPHNGGLFLNPDQYLVEGNLFVKRAEYLTLRGMNPKIGPRNGRFGYHEGSEFQNRLLGLQPAHAKRFYLPALAVYHSKANPSNSILLSFISGYDSIAAFPKSTRSSYWASIFKFPGRLALFFVRSIFAVLNKKTKRRQKIYREVYRIGEVFGEMSFQFSKQSFQLNQLRRLWDNRLTFNSKKVELPETGIAALPIAATLAAGETLAAGKIGTAEILALEFHDRRTSALLAGFGWRRPAQRLSHNAGFFPVTRQAYGQWNEIMRESLTYLDYICLWQNDPFLREYECCLRQKYNPQSQCIPMSLLGKEILPQILSARCLIISPFVETMKRQLDVLPLIHDPENKWQADWDAFRHHCEFLKCPLHWHLVPSPFVSWASGLKIMTEQALEKKFDLALVGAGAWSLPLVAALKKDGRSGVHMGGDTQLLFGIKGKRWDSFGFYNDHWTSLLPEESPRGSERIDSGCYW